MNYFKLNKISDINPFDLINIINTIIYMTRLGTAFITLLDEYYDYDDILNSPFLKKDKKYCREYVAKLMSTVELSNNEKLMLYTLLLKTGTNLTAKQILEDHIEKGFGELNVQYTLEINTLLIEAITNILFEPVDGLKNIIGKKNPILKKYAINNPSLYNLLYISTTYGGVIE